MHTYSKNINIISKNMKNIENDISKNKALSFDTYTISKHFLNRSDHQFYRERPSSSWHFDREIEPFYFEGEQRSSDSQARNVSRSRRVNLSATRIKAFPNRPFAMGTSSKPNLHRRASETTTSSTGTQLQLGYCDELLLERIRPQAFNYLLAKGYSPHLAEDFIAEANTRLREKGIGLLLNPVNRFLVLSGVFFPSDTEIIRYYYTLLNRVAADHFRWLHAKKRDERLHSSLDDFQWSVIRDDDAKDPSLEVESNENAREVHKLVKTIYGPFYSQADARDQAIMNALDRMNEPKLKSNLVYNNMTSRERTLFLPSGREPAISAESSAKRAIYKRLILLPEKVSKFPYNPNIFLN